MRYLLRLTQLLTISILTVGCDVSTDLRLGEEHVEPGEEQLAESMAELIETISIQRSRAQPGPIKRFNQAKSLGCFAGRFTVYDELPEKLSRGIFAAPATYPATLRFANASQEDDREKDLRGLSIKISDYDRTI